MVIGDWLVTNGGPFATLRALFAVLLDSTTTPKDSPPAFLPFQSLDIVTTTVHLLRILSSFTEEGSSSTHLNKVSAAT